MEVNQPEAFFTWLRRTGRIRRQDDPTLDLMKPPAPPCTWDRVVPTETLDACLRELPLRYADLLTVLMGTGWHVTELLRFCGDGWIDGDVLVCPRHKSGEPHRSRVSPAVRAAAERSMAAGTFNLSLFCAAIGEACARAGVERLGLGSLRHTAATNAIRNGATPDEAAYFMGHKSSYMVKQIYAKAAVPRKIPTLA